MSSSDRYVLVTSVQSRKTSEMYPIKWDRTRRELTCRCGWWVFQKSRKGVCPHVLLAQEELAAAGLTAERAAALLASTGLQTLPQAPNDPIRVEAERIAFLFRRQGAMTFNEGMAAEVETAIRKFAGTTTKPLAPARPDWLGGGRAILLRD